MLILHVFLSLHLLSKVPEHFLITSSRHHSSSSSQALLPLCNPQDLVGSQVLAGLDALIGQPARGRASPGENRGAPRNLFVLLCSQLPFLAGKSAPALTLFSCCHLQQLTLWIFFPLIPDQPKHRQLNIFPESSDTASVIQPAFSNRALVVRRSHIELHWLFSHSEI